MNRLYARNPKVTVRQVEDEIFLADPNSEGLYHLNAVGAALWRLLADPIGVPEAVSVLHAAFPDVVRHRIETDVTALIGELVDNGLVTDLSQKAAEGPLREAKELPPGKGEASLELAKRERKRGLRAALETAKAALERGPTSAEAHLLAADLLQDLERFDEAIPHYRRTATLKPDCAEAHNKLGDLYTRQGRLKKAAAAYRKAGEAWPRGRDIQHDQREAFGRMIAAWHFPMLNDWARNTAYQRAIEKAVAKLGGDAVVLDIGTGSGLLSMMAARAGARRVVACEMVKALAETAREIISANGYGDRIAVVDKRSTQLELGRDLPAPASLVIHELFDDTLLSNGVIPALRHAVLNLTEPDAIFVPAAAVVWGQVIECPELRAVNPIRVVSGFDLTALDMFRDPAAHVPARLEHTPHKALTEPFELARFEFNKPPAGDVDRQLTLTAKERGTGHAVAFWWDLRQDGEIIYSNRSGDPLCHWGHAIQFLDRDLDLAAGQSFVLSAGHTDTRFVLRAIENP